MFDCNSRGQNRTECIGNAVLTGCSSRKCIIVKSHNLSQCSPPSDLRTKTFIGHCLRSCICTVNHKNNLRQIKLLLLFTIYQNMIHKFLQLIYHFTCERFVILLISENFRAICAFQIHIGSLTCLFLQKRDTLDNSSEVVRKAL